MCFLFCDVCLILELPYKFEYQISAEPLDLTQVMRRAEWVVFKYRQSYGSVHFCPSQLTPVWMMFRFSFLPLPHNSPSCFQLIPLHLICSFVMRKIWECLSDVYQFIPWKGRPFSKCVFTIYKLKMNNFMHLYENTLTIHSIRKTFVQLSNQPCGSSAVHKTVQSFP